MSRFTVYFLFIFISLLSCAKEEETKSKSYQTGTFIVNEGPFGSGTGTIAYFDGTNITQDVYGIQNNGNVLGNIAQSMIKMNDKYFIAVNNADKVQVVSAEDFKSVGVIENIKFPRYFANVSNKLYLSSWSEDRSKGAIHQLDPNSFQILATLPINDAAEKILSYGDLLYITLTSATSDVILNSILVLDTKTNTFVDTITVGDNPKDLVTDKNGDIWVICSGFTDWNNPALSTNGSLHKVKNGLSLQNFNLPNGANGISIDNSGEKLYYIAGGKVWERSIAGTEKMIIEGNFYAIGLDKKGNKIYVSDALDYQKPGIVSQVDLNTLTKVDFTAGIIPSYFYFSE
jgi:DNA-binding beta-propeller fold protein YncE